MKPKPIERRAYLFLQGPPGPFFKRLGDTLKERGFPVHRINFNGGDRADWHEDAIDYRGRAKDWPHYFDNFVVTHHITDVILFGDCRPLHEAAHGMAVLRKLRIHVFEEGYIRPDWVTMELDGVNGRSTLSRDPKWYVSQAKALLVTPDLPPIPAIPGLRSRQAFRYYFNLTKGGLRFPFYRSHRPNTAVWEGLGWCNRFLGMPRAEKRTGKTLAKIATVDHFLLPLQLSSDHQIRVHSPFTNMKVATEYVVASFARSAPKDVHLVIKLHPLDNGLAHWRRTVSRLEQLYDIKGRLHFLEGGDIAQIVQGARGVVTVNSTTGTLALGAGVPVKVLGRAIYDIEGITDQSILDDFWQGPSKPDPKIYDAFCRTLIDRCLIRGGFASPEGLQLLVDEAFRRLTTNSEASLVVRSLA
jgi:capsular polysaccharide export protein